jgi:hypothetical protein
MNSTIRMIALRPMFIAGKRENGRHVHRRVSEMNAIFGAGCAELIDNADRERLRSSSRTWTTGVPERRSVRLGATKLAVPSARIAW